MGNLDAISARIHDRATIDWLTPSQKAVWNSIKEFDGPPHRVINIYGSEGTGKTFLGWIMERERYATYMVWRDTPKLQFSRLVIDDAKSDRTATREIRPMVDALSLKQIILLSRTCIDEPSVPAFELRVLNEDVESLKANLFRHLRVAVPEGSFRNYKSLLNEVS
jgi:hypothetical protein